MLLMIPLAIAPCLRSPDSFYHLRTAQPVLSAVDRADHPRRAARIVSTATGPLEIHLARQRN